MRARPDEARGQYSLNQAIGVGLLGFMAIAMCLQVSSMQPIGSKPDASVPSGGPPSSVAGAQGSEPTEAQAIVAVAGCIPRPGLYALPPEGGLSVGRLIAAAGGPRVGLQYRARIVPRVDASKRAAAWKDAGGVIDSWGGGRYLVVQPACEGGNFGKDPIVFAGDLLIVDDAPNQEAWPSTPEWELLTAERIGTMPRQEILDRLVQVVRWRHRMRLDEPLSARLRCEFDLLVTALQRTP